MTLPPAFTSLGGKGGGGEEEGGKEGRQAYLSLIQIVSEGGEKGELKNHRINRREGASHTVSLESLSFTGKEEGKGRERKRSSVGVAPFRLSQLAAREGGGGVRRGRLRGREEENYSSPADRALRSWRRGKGGEKKRKKACVDEC